MKVLLDSCAVLALASGNLPSVARENLATAREACISIVSPWEIAIKKAKGKLTVNEAVQSWFSALVARYQLRVLPLDLSIVCAAAELPLIHRDPFDRILVATAIEHKLILLSSDQTISRYPGVQVIWQ